MPFEVLVRGELSEELMADLGVRQFDFHRGKTLILLDVIDQSHLHGVLGWFEGPQHRNREGQSGLSPREELA